MKSLATALLLTGALLCGACGEAPESAGGDARPSSAPQAPLTVDDAVARGAERVELRVEGMHCPACVGKVHQALSALDGVSAVSVDLESGSCAVACDPASCPPERCAEVVAAAGFPAQVER